MGVQGRRKMRWGWQLLVSLAPPGGDTCPLRPYPKRLASKMGRPYSPTPEQNRAGRHQLLVLLSSLSRVLKGRQSFKSLPGEVNKVQRELLSRIFGWRGWRHRPSLPPPAKSPAYGPVSSHQIVQSFRQLNRLSHRRIQCSRYRNYNWKQKVKKIYSPC